MQIKHVIIATWIPRKLRLGLTFRLLVAEVLLLPREINLCEQMEHREETRFA